MRKNTSAFNMEIVYQMLQLFINMISTTMKTLVVVASILSTCLLVAVIVLTTMDISVKLCAEGAAYAYSDGRKVGQLEECLSLEVTPGIGTLRLQQDPPLEGSVTQLKEINV